MATTLLAERLNTEPPVSRGCSVIEIVAILGGAVGLFLPLGGVIGWWQGVFQLGLAGGVIAIVLTMALVPSCLQRMKRDRPHGYYQHWFAVRLEDLAHPLYPHRRLLGPRAARVMSAVITKLKPLWMRLTADPPLTLGEGRYRALIDNVQAQNRRLWRLVVFLVALLGLAVYGLHRARQALPPVHIPPELRFGATLAWGEVPLPNVYLFAGYIFQQLHLWKQDGYTDYGSNIYRLQAFLTPRYRAELEADLEWRGRRGELQGRIRQLAPLSEQGFEAKRTEPLGGGRWRVWVDFAIDETVKGMPVKQARVRYPLEVVLQDVDPEHNPWGLALDGYGSEAPLRLSEDEASQAFRRPPSKERERVRS